MPALTDQQASVVALFVESVCYGIYLVTLGLCLRTLLWTKDGGGMKTWSQINRLMLVICCIMPITATINLSLNVVRAVESVGPTGVSEQFTNVGSATEVTKFFCVNFQTLVADFMLTYRCWMIYGKSWLMAACPVFLWVGVLVTVILNLIILRQTHNGALTAATALRPTVTSFWSISIALNIFTTSLIVWRLYRVDKDLSIASVSRLGHSTGQTSYTKLSRIIRIIIESGLLYTSIAICACVTYATGDQGLYVTSAIEMQAVGIAFNLIIIRVAMHDHTGYTTKAQDTHISLRIVARPESTAEVASPAIQETDHVDEHKHEPMRFSSDTISYHTVGKAV